MDRDSFTYLQPRDPHHGDHEASKTTALRPFSVQNRSEETQYYEGEQNSRPNTPSMTNGSSRSNSSSIITCETCGNSGNHCACTSYSDSETFRLFNREEWTKSPHSSPALLARQAKGKLPSQGSRLRQLGHRLPYPKPASRTSTYSIPGRDQHLELDSETSTPLKSVSSTGKQYSPSDPLNDTTLANSTAEARASENAMECLTSDSEAEDDEDDEDDEDESDEDNDWSGQDSNLEAIILKAVGDDLPLAAHLIPIVHRSLRSEFAMNATEKLGSWRYGVIKSAQGSGAADEQTSASYAAEATNNPRKRPRYQGSSKKQSRKLNDFDEEDDDDDDDPQDSKGLEDDTGTDGQQPLPRLACPFHKRDPGKYSIQHGDVEGPRKAEYRACEGPGFKSIQRLKEHLKRKHYPVQCDRCYRIFPGSDRAACVLELQDHRQLAVPCERRSDSGKEGISEAQWANLDKKKSSKKSRVSSRIALWMEYWDILFPGTQQPATPWYDNKIPSRVLQPTSEEVRRFAELFRPMLNLRVSQQDIRFLEGQEDAMKTRVETLVYQAFSIYVGLNGSPSTTNSSSSRSRQQTSMLGGSFQHISTPRTSRGQISSSDSRSTAAQSQAYSMDVATSPAAISMPPRSLSQGHPTTMGPPFMGMPRMSAQNFRANTMQSTMPNEQPTHGGFHSTMGGNLGAFGEDLFVGNGLAAGDGHWEPIDFNNADPNFYGSHPTPSLSPAGYVDISRSPLDQTLLDPAEDNAHNLAELRGFDGYQNSRSLRYSGTQ